MEFPALLSAVRLARGGVPLSLPALPSLVDHGRVVAKHDGACTIGAGVLGVDLADRNGRKRDQDQTKDAIARFFAAVEASCSGSATGWMAPPKALPVRGICVRMGRRAGRANGSYPVEPIDRAALAATLTVHAIRWQAHRDAERRESTVVITRSSGLERHEGVSALWAGVTFAAVEYNAAIVLAVAEPLRGDIAEVFRRAAEAAGGDEDVSRGLAAAGSLVAHYWHPETPDAERAALDAVPAGDPVWHDPELRARFAPEVA
jgi:hypothetical protein